MEGIILIADGRHGVFAPQIAIQSLVKEITDQIPAETYGELIAGPDNEYYWEAWENVLEEIFTFEDKQYCFVQSDDGDVFFIELERLEEFYQEHSDEIE